MYTMDYYLSMKKNSILPFATAWIDLAGIALSEIKSEKVKYISFHLGVTGLGSGGMGQKAKGIRRYKLVFKSWGCKIQHKEY